MGIEASITEAKTHKLFYLVANIILVHTKDNTCLLLRRSPTEKEAGGQWGFPGGKAEHQNIVGGRVNDFFGIVALDECRQETGLKFDPAKTSVIANGAFIRKDGIPVVWVTLAAPYEGGTVGLEAGAFTEYAWFTAETLPAADACVGTVRDEAVLAINALGES